MLPPEEAGLGPQGEEEWLRLRRQVELAEGFWLGFIFAPSPRETRTLCQRTERLLHGQTRQLRRHVPSRPEELADLLRELLTPATRDIGCHWIEALHLDSGARPEGPWHQAWIKLVVLMNERRDALRRHFRGGLVLVAPPQMKPHFREMASDLWSVRALVIELLPVAQPVGERALPDAPSRRFEGTTPDTDFILAELRRILSGELKSYRALGSVLTQAVEELLASGRASEALEAARRAWERIHARVQEEPRSSAVVLHALANAEEANGDFAAATEHLERAVALTREDSDRQRLRLLLNLGRLAFVRRDLREASRAYEEALTLSRLRSLAHGSTPEALRDLSVSLDNVGDLRRARGELAAAAETFEESLSLFRQVRVMLGDIPQATQDLLYMLAQVATTRQALGDAQGAQAARAEADALRGTSG